MATCGCCGFDIGHIDNACPVCLPNFRATSGHVASGKHDGAVASQSNGIVPTEYNEQQERNRHDAEDLEALHKCLDKHGVPRADAGGAVFSAWGRVLRFVAPAPTDAEILETAKWALYPVKPCDENTIAFVRRLQSAVDSRF